MLANPEEYKYNAQHINTKNKHKCSKMKHFILTLSKPWIYSVQNSLRVEISRKRSQNPRIQTNNIISKH